MDNDTVCVAGDVREKMKRLTRSSEAVEETMVPLVFGDSFLGSGRHDGIDFSDGARLRVYFDGTWMSGCRLHGDGWPRHMGG